jgi:hypothetical protein
MGSPPLHRCSASHNHTASVTHRRFSTIYYQLLDSFAMTISAEIRSADGWEDVTTDRQTHVSWFGP